MSEINNNVRNVAIYDMDEINNLIGTIDKASVTGVNNIMLLSQIVSVLGAGKVIEAVVNGDEYMFPSAAPVADAAPTTPELSGNETTVYDADEDTSNSDEIPVNPEDIEVIPE